jgi:thiol-disulfide isomerase/thioredoxin
MYIKILLILFILVTFNLHAEKMTPFQLKEYSSDNIYDLAAENKKTLINFWASWCTSCIKEIDELEALKKKYPHYQFIAVSAGDTKKKIKRFLKKNPWSYKVLMDQDKKVTKGLGVLNLPQTWVIDEKGNIVYKETTPPKTLP